MDKATENNGSLNEKKSGNKSSASKAIDNKANASDTKASLSDTSPMQTAEDTLPVSDDHEALHAQYDRHNDIDLLPSHCYGSLSGWTRDKPFGVHLKESFGAVEEDTGAEIDKTDDIKKTQSAQEGEILRDNTANRAGGLSAESIKENEEGSQAGGVEAKTDAAPTEDVDLNKGNVQTDGTTSFQDEIAALKESMERLHEEKVIHLKQYKNFYVQINMTPDMEPFAHISPERLKDLPEDDLEAVFQLLWGQRKKGD